VLTDGDQAVKAAPDRRLEFALRSQYVTAAWLSEWPGCRQLQVLQDFLEAVAAGTAAVPIGRVYRFDQIAEAHTDMEQNRAGGKLVVTTWDGPPMERGQMKIAVLGAGAVGSTIGRLWHAAGHDVTFAARHATRPRALAAELGERAHAASAAEAVAAAEAVLVD
jgi:D-arabinose 1-dehydrogenase-like Zn-dependent alcohol dehydrogenase